MSSLRRTKIIEAIVLKDFSKRKEKGRKNTRSLSLVSSSVLDEGTLCNLCQALFGQCCIGGGAPLLQIPLKNFCTPSQEERLTNEWEGKSVISDRQQEKNILNTKPTKSQQKNHEYS